MNGFFYKDGVLHVDDVSLLDIEKQFTTPVYIYSKLCLSNNYKALEEALEDKLGEKHPKLIAYSVKANSNIAVINVLKKLGSGADVVSSGELKRVTKAGIKGDKIVFSGVGKTEEELSLALDSDVMQFNIESVAELEMLSNIAILKKKKAPIAFRINPDIDAGGHEKISTGGSSTKFGIPYKDALNVYEYAKNLPGIKVVGIDIHIGSQITDLEPFKMAFNKVLLLYKELKGNGHNIVNLDLGGGIGVPYDNNTKPFHIDKYADLINQKFGALDCKLIFEPGRYITANAGILLTKVIINKESYNNNFLIIDAAMNDILRPALYDAYHEVISVKENIKGQELIDYEVVGPICETGDIICRKAALNKIESGDLLAIKFAGAYGAVMSSGYNSRDLVPEIMISSKTINIIRKRILIEDFMSYEDIPS